MGYRALGAGGSSVSAQELRTRRVEHIGGALSLSAQAIFHKVDDILAGAYAASGSLQVTVRPDGYVLARSDHSGSDSPLHAVQQVVGSASE